MYMKYDVDVPYLTFWSIVKFLKQFNTYYRQI